MKTDQTAQSTIAMMAGSIPSSSAITSGTVAMAAAMTAAFRTRSRRAEREWVGSNVPTFIGAGLEPARLVHRVLERLAAGEPARVLDQQRRAALVEVRPAVSGVRREQGVRGVP